MFKGFYTAASGMIAQQRRTEIATNNMSNANTPGYKPDQTSMRAFPEMLLQQIGKVSAPVQSKGVFLASSPIGSLNTGVYMQEATPDFRQGDFEQTDFSTDLALSGESVFFTIENEAGEIRYSRNGNFALDPEGFLTTASGSYVLGQNGDRIQLGSNEFTVNETGEIEEEGQVVGQIGTAYAENPSNLVKEQNGLYRNDGANLPPALGAANFSIKQFSLERSTTNAAQSMTDMMTAYRSFEANQKVLMAYDRSMEKAANELGRVT